MIYDTEKMFKQNLKQNERVNHRHPSKSYEFTFT